MSTVVNGAGAGAGADGVPALPHTYNTLDMILVIIVTKYNSSSTRMRREEEMERSYIISKTI